MDDLNKSFQEAVCFGDEVFFGPITEKERKIREEFECKFKSQLDIESNKTFENEISHNDSLYKSFSESKYDSFEDSLSIGVDKPEALRSVALKKKSLDTLKSKNHGFYDSLEDVHSLVSNMDKCSISCDVETNFAEVHVEDSLKNGTKIIFNNNSPSEQINFDEDSLAILELESTFDDSLEEYNVQSIDIEEVDNLGNIVSDTLNVNTALEQRSSNVTRNLFDVSAEVIYEKKQAFNSEDLSSSDEKKIFDSLSNSDSRDIIKDSLEESQNSSSNLNSKNANMINSYVSENIEMSSVNKDCDASIPVIYETVNNFQINESMIESNISSSEGVDISKDSLENCKNEVVNITDKPLQEIVHDDEMLNSLSNCNLVKPIYDIKSQEHLDVSEKIILHSAEAFNDTEKSTVSNSPPPFSKENLNNDIKNHLEAQLLSNAVSSSLEQFSTITKLVYHEIINDKLETDSSSQLVEVKNPTCTDENEFGNVNPENVLCETNANANEKSVKNNLINITQRIKSSNRGNDKRKCNIDTMESTNLLHALDLHDISISILNEPLSDEFVQSKDSLVPLNLCIMKQNVESSYNYMNRIESKENMPELNLTPITGPFNSNKLKNSYQKIKESSKSPTNLKNSKNTPTKRTPGTKIPVRKVDNFALPITSPNIKCPVSKVICPEKVKKSPVSDKVGQSPMPCCKEVKKNTPGLTPQRGHYCKVRNTIFSKVPQITQSKRYLSIKSPVAEYIRSNPAYVVKTPLVDHVLRDCMNIPLQEEMETPSPINYLRTPKSAPVKSTKKKF